MGRLDAPDTIPDRDPALIIGEGGVHYRCPDLKALGKHITELSWKIDGTEPRFARLLAMCRRDLDLLLQRYQERSAQEATT